MTTKRIAFIGAHPDDIELSAGGAIKVFLQKGYFVSCIICTGKESKDHKGKEIRNQLEINEELYKPLRSLGVENIFVLGKQDMNLTWSHELVSAIEQILDEYKINTVFTHNVHDTHQDHVAVAQASISASRRIHNLFMFEPITPSGRGPVPFNPQLYIQISDFIDDKLTALKLHKSQYKRYGEAWIKGVESRCGYRGFEISESYAEAFEIIRILEF